MILIVAKALLALLVAVALSPVYSAGDWLKWQDMKKETILPLGSWTGRYGGTMSFLLKAVCYLALVLLVPALGWWVAGTFVVIWFASGWLATLMERKAYATQQNMDLIVYAAKKYTTEKGAKFAAEVLSEIAPKWWIKLMPPSWRAQLHDQLATILLSSEASENPEPNKHRNLIPDKFARGTMDQSQFNRWTDFWIDVASSVIVDVADLRAELKARDKLRLAALVFGRLEPECTAFMRIVIGESKSETSEGVCYNRLSKVPIQQMSRVLQSKTIDLLQETFYLGLFTLLYVMHFPTREKISSVDLTQVFRKWTVDAILPSHVLGRLDQGITDIFQVHFSLHIEPLLKRELGVGMFGLRRHKRFFLEPYLAGFLLGLECDMATKQKGVARKP